MFVLRNRLNKFASALLNWSRSLDPSSAFGAVHFTVMMRINSSFKQCINTYVTSSAMILYYDLALTLHQPVILDEILSLEIPKSLKWRQGVDCGCHKRLRRIFRFISF